MKKIVSLYIIATALIFASCTDDTTPVTAKYVTVDLQIGGDSTLNLSGGSTSFEYSNSAKEFVKGKTITATRSSDIHDFVPVVPTQFTAYLVANENTSEYPNAKDNAQVIATCTVNTGSNYITVPAMKYKVFVTNYINGDEKRDNGWNNWYIWSNAPNSMPQSTTTLYLYGKNEDMDFTNGAVGEIVMTNPYAAVCVYKNDYIKEKPYDNTGGTYFASDNEWWYYDYIRCINPTKTNIAINKLNNYKSIQEQVSANNIYQYIINDN